MKDFCFQQTGRNFVQMCSQARHYSRTSSQYKNWKQKLSGISLERSVPEHSFHLQNERTEKSACGELGWTIFQCSCPKFLFFGTLFQRNWRGASVLCLGVVFWVVFFAKSRKSSCPDLFIIFLTVTDECVAVCMRSVLNMKAAYILKHFDKWSYRLNWHKSCNWMFCLERTDSSTYAGNFQCVGFV